MSGRQCFQVLVVVALWVSGGTLAGTTAVQASADHHAVQWQRLRPLDNNPAQDSGVALHRACIPGETVVLRKNHGADTPQRLGLRTGQFVVCVRNSSGGLLEVVDGPGNSWFVEQGDVNATRGFPLNWQAHDRNYLVWSYSRDTIVFRESLANSFEGNFFYLLLDLAEDGEVYGGLLIDSGTGHADLKPYLLPLIGDKPLLVVSTHNHWDHFGGHRHLRDLPNALLLGYRPGPVYNPYPVAPEYDLDGLRDYFALHDWPLGSSEFTVGARRLKVLPIPGHTEDSVAFYDHREQLLFTGDTVCPCYLFIEDWQQFAASLERLQDFAARQPVRWLLGGHVEMSHKRPWNDMHEYFYFGSNTHWDALPVQMPPEYLRTASTMVEQAIARSGEGKPQYDARYIDLQFHAIPLVPIPFPGIPPYFRLESERLVEELRSRHEQHDVRRGASREQEQ